MGQCIYNIINWWIRLVDENYWLYGNNDYDSCVPGYFIFELIEPVKVSEISATHEGLLIKSKSSNLYFCSFNYFLGNDYSFFDVMDGSACDKKHYVELIKDGQQQRIKEDIINVVGLLQQERIEINLSDKYDSLFEFGNYISNNGIEYTMKTERIEEDTVCLFAQTDDKDIYRSYKILDRNYIRVNKILGVPLLIFNNGIESLKVSTTYGEYELLPDKTVYLISPCSYRGRITNI